MKKCEQNSKASLLKVQEVTCHYAVSLHSPPCPPAIPHAWLSHRLSTDIQQWENPLPSSMPRSFCFPSLLAIPPLFQSFLPVSYRSLFIISLEAPSSYRQPLEFLEREQSRCESWEESIYTFPCYSVWQHGAPQCAEENSACLEFRVVWGWPRKWTYHDR